MKTNINEKYYSNLSEAVAFKISFIPMIYSYDDFACDDIEKEVCSRCGQYEQIIDFPAPRSECVKKDCAMLDTYHYGVSIEIHNELITNFDISEQDFRPVRNKTGDIVFYQITPQHTMLPVDSVNRIRKLKPCRKCGSIQYREKEYKNEYDMTYGYITQEALDDLADLNVSYEKYEMYMPWYVVSKRVFEYITKKYPRARFEPLFLK